MITLNEIVHKIVEKAKELPNVGTIVLNDIYQLNAMQNVQYSSIAITQNQHRYNKDDRMMFYSFNIFYVDRLTENKHNELDVQSMGVQLLHYLVEDLEETTNVFIADNYTFDTFTEKFDSLCAGAFVTITLGVSDDCVEL